MPYISPTSTTQANQDLRNTIRIRAQVYQSNNTTEKTGSRFESQQVPRWTVNLLGPHHDNNSRSVTASEIGASDAISKCPAPTDSYTCKGLYNRNEPVVTNTVLKKQDGIGKPSVLRRTLEYHCSAAKVHTATAFKPRKTVHFKQAITKTQYFCKDESPITISMGRTNCENGDGAINCLCTASTRWEMRLQNAALKRSAHLSQPVSLESIFLYRNAFLVGYIAVANIAFQKQVWLRFSTDHWGSMAEVAAEYDSQKKLDSGDGVDRFKFSINIADPGVPASLHLCIRYEVGGQQFWDNNGGADYEIKFTETIKSSSAQRVFENIVGSRSDLYEALDPPFGAEAPSTNINVYAPHRLPKINEGRLSSARSNCNPVATSGGQTSLLLTRYDINASLKEALSMTRLTANG